MSKVPLRARRSDFLCLLIPALFVGGAVAQTAPAVRSETIADRVAASPIVNLPVDRGAYILGTGDQVTVRVFGADDMPERPTEVGPDGKINLPMVGKVQAAGIPVRTLEANLTTRYSTYFKDPQVSVNVTDYRSEPVTVVGSVSNPSVIQLHGPTRVMQVISMAGGLRPEAGDRIMITRPLSPDKSSAPAADPNDPNAKFYVKEVDLQKIIDGSDPSANVMVQANDVITVPRARMVYVVGDVIRPGGYVLDGHNSSLSVLQAIALAGGINKTAAKSKTRILHATAGGDRVESMLDLGKIMGSKSPDVPLHADDILFVPNSAAKNAGIRALEIGLNVGTGIAVFR
ncbi:MAG TPA: polysaccharide biosynthesis/export family protein [Acidobacteriaceae bacterium]